MQGLSLSLARNWDYKSSYNCQLNRLTFGVWLNTGTSKLPWCQVGTRSSEWSQDPYAWYRDRNKTLRGDFTYPNNCWIRAEWWPHHHPVHHPPHPSHIITLRLVLQTFPPFNHVNVEVSFHLFVKGHNVFVNAALWPKVEKVLGLNPLAWHDDWLIECVCVRNSKCFCWPKDMCPLLDMCSLCTSPARR